MNTKNEIMNGVTEYYEGEDVEFTNINDRPVVVGVNEGGHNSVTIDLIELLQWVKKNKPEIWNLI